MWRYSDGPVLALWDGRTTRILDGLRRESGLRETSQSVVCRTGLISQHAVHHAWRGRGAWYVCQSDAFVLLQAAFYSPWVIMLILLPAQLSCINLIDPGRRSGDVRVGSVCVWIVRVEWHDLESAWRKNNSRTLTSWVGLLVTIANGAINTILISYHLSMCTMLISNQLIYILDILCVLLHSHTQCFAVTQFQMKLTFCGISQWTVSLHTWVEAISWQVIEHRDWGEDESQDSCTEERGGESSSSLNRQPLSLGRN